MGTGEWDWEPLEDGQEIDVIQGPQGGFHLLGSVRVAGIAAGTADDLGDPDNPTTRFWVMHEGVDLAPSSVFIQGLDASPQDASPFTHQMVGRFVIMDIAADDELDGVEIAFDVSVEDVDGVRVLRGDDAHRRPAPAQPLGRAVFWPWNSRLAAPVSRMGGWCGYGPGNLPPR